MGTVIGVVGTTIVLVSPFASDVPIAGCALAAGAGVAVAPRTSAIACAVTLSGSRAACSVLPVLSRTRRSTFLPPPLNIIHIPAPAAINIRKKIAAGAVSGGERILCVAGLDLRDAGRAVMAPIVISG